MAEVLPAQMPAGVMSPGTFLRKRRLAAGLSQVTIARHLVGMPWPIGEPTPAQINAFVRMLDRVELDQLTLNGTQAQLLAEVVPFDLGAYRELVMLRDAGPDTDLLRPNICRDCACTFLSACIDAAGRPCAWVDGQANLCTACTACAAADWPDAPQPEGAEA